MMQTADKWFFDRRTWSRSFLKTTATTLVVLPLLLYPQAISAAEPDQAPLTVEFHRPEVEFSALLHLFSKSSVGHPAAALAAWKNGPGRDHSFGKGTEALIALLNPRMTEEWKSLDQARCTLGKKSKDGNRPWRLTLPRDDGSMEAFATSLTLTDGETIDPIRNIPVRRLGKPGTFLSASIGSKTAFASDRDQLEAALAFLEQPTAVPLAPSGLDFRVEPSALEEFTSLEARQFKAAIKAAGVLEMSGRLHVEQDAIRADWVANLAPDVPPSRTPISKEWLEGLPSMDTLAVLALSIETDPKSLAYLFEIADRVEKSDPRRAEVAPLRIRLNLLAAAARVRPESDIWPLLKGISAAVGGKVAAEFERVVIGLHLSDPEAAERFSAGTLPKLLQSKPGSTRAFIEKTPIEWEARGSSVWIGCGVGAFQASKAAADGTSPSALRAIEPFLPQAMPIAISALWPGEAYQADWWGEPFSKALDQSPPLVWQSSREGTSLHDHLEWSGLQDTIKRWLDALPLVPPADRATPR